jgi:ATP-dependent Clp protease ATP-binding subunit ClpC
MSEYSGHGSAERLLSDSQGGPGELIKRMRQQPFAVVLLDEIEKAAIEVFDALLGVFDEGRLTDPLGRTTTFCSAIIIMTSNLGSDRGDSIGFGDRPEPSYVNEAMSFFRPEFFNRIDAVVRFSPLDRDTIRTITRKELADIAEREGFVTAGLRIVYSDNLITHLCREGFDARYGARPLQRKIETLIGTALARYIVENPGIKNKTLRLDLDSRGNVAVR